MVGVALKKYAKEHNLKCDGGFVYGEISGYALSMDDGADLKRLFIHTRFPDTEQKAAFETMLGTAGLNTQYRIQNSLVEDRQISFVFRDTIGTMGLIGQFIDWLLPQLPQYGATGADVCTECGCTMSGQGKWAVVGDSSCHMHESCLRSVSETIRAQEGAAKENAQGSYLSGAIGALIGGLLGAVVWGVILNFGWVAGVVGFLIGFLAEKGYTLLNGKLGKGKLFILIAVIIVSIFVGTMFGEYLMLAQAIKDEGIVLGDSSTLQFFFSLLEDEEARSLLMGDVVKNGLLGLLFAGLAVFSLLKKTNAEVSGTKIKELK